MNLLLDVGNTRLKAAIDRDGMLGETATFALADDAFVASFDAWLAANAIASPQAWLAAVAPDNVIEKVAAALARHRIVAERVTTQSQALGVRIAYTDASRLGVDRWLNLLAAHQRSPGATLIVSVGTALTIDALLPDGRHLGGLIAPTPEVARAALIARAPRLDVAAGRIARFATSTEDAVASGAVLAAAALVERSAAELAGIAGTAPSLLLTGGGAAELQPWLPPHQRIDDLVLHGLARWASVAGRRG
jgi:type III pantothenate kinase